MFFTFWREKLLEKNFSRWMSASAYKRREVWRETYTHLYDFWFEVSFFWHVKKIPLRFWFVVSFFFFRVWKHRSLLWLARTHLRMKIYDMAFWWVFLSMYMIVNQTLEPQNWTLKSRQANKFSKSTISDPFHSSSSLFIRASFCMCCVMFKKKEEGFT